MQSGLNTVNLMTYTLCLFFKHRVAGQAGIEFKLLSGGYSTMLSTEVVGSQVLIIFCV